MFLKCNILVASLSPRLWYTITCSATNNTHFSFSHNYRYLFVLLKRCKNVRLFLHTFPLSCHIMDAREESTFHSLFLRGHNDDSLWSAMFFNIFLFLGFTSLYFTPLSHFFTPDEFFIHVKSRKPTLNH